MFYVYILYSPIFGELYIGSTNNLKTRLQQHHDGAELSTKRYRPWKLVYYEAYTEEKLARRREQRLKHHGSAMHALKKRLELFPMKSKKRHSSRSGAGFTLTETLITGALFGLAILVSTLLLSNERARTRDALRIADMTRLASGFALLYAQQATYAPAAVGCGSVGSLASVCTLTAALGDISTLKDPGRFRYTVSQVPNRDNFAISFRLERRYGPWFAGPHFLTKAGIQ